MSVTDGAYLKVSLSFVVFSTLRLVFCCVLLGNRHGRGIFRAFNALFFPYFMLILMLSRFGQKHLLFH